MLNELSREITELAKRQGFTNPETIHGDDAPLMMAKLMLVVTEAAEAAEAIRNGDEENFAEEIADVIIRCAHICGAAGIDIESIVSRKMEKNRNRPIRHGRKVGL